MAASADWPCQLESVGAWGMTTRAGYRSGLHRRALPMPTSVWRRPSEPRSPAPCRKRITGHGREASYSRGTYTWYG